MSLAPQSAPITGSRAVGLGFAHMGTGDTVDAKRTIRRAVGLRPGGTAPLGRGQRLSSSGIGVNLPQRRGFAANGFAVEWAMEHGFDRRQPNTALAQFDARRRQRF